MELPARVEYALLALLELATNATPQEPLKANAIAERQEIAARYLEQILSLLRHEGMIISTRGATGGYVLARHPSEITLWQVFACLEGENLAKIGCPDSTVSLSKTVLREMWQQSAAAAQNVLRQYTLEDLINQRNAHGQAKLMFYI